jgi:hypothetical protein
LFKERILLLPSLPAATGNPLITTTFLPLNWVSAASFCVWMERPPLTVQALLLHVQIFDVKVRDAVF